MYSLVEIQNVIDVIEIELVTYTENEINGYSYGSYYQPVYYRGATEYLELYVFVLYHIKDILSQSLDYNDFGFDDKSITYVINKCNELMFFYN